jgi:hypothetical protein
MVRHILRVKKFKTAHEHAVYAIMVAVRTYGPTAFQYYKETVEIISLCFPTA